MTEANEVTTKTRKPLRVWPGVVLVILLWAIRFGWPAVDAEAGAWPLLGSLALAPLILLWWLFFSRAPWRERLGGLAVVAAALLVLPFVVHPSIAGGGMGMLPYLLAIPGLCLALVAWAVATRRLGDRVRWATLPLALGLAVLALALLRTEGLSASFDNDLAWRWTPTPEERLLAAAEEVPEVVAAPAIAAPAVAAADASPPAGAEPGVTVAASEPATVGEADSAPDSTMAAAGVASPPPPAWPGFRGPARDGVVRGARIATDWATSPPTEVWRRPVGPGWSSFAVDGDRFFTQEQRGDDEVVTAYELATGDPVWMHRDPVRFWESNAGAGPRGTPTLHQGRVYTLGGTGLVNALDAATGAVVWTRDAAADAEAKLPTWGFSGSPLVVGDRVLVAASGNLVAYDRATGEPRWRGPAGGPSYSSPHLATIGGVEQVLQLSKTGVTSLAPDDGTVLWEHAWNGYPIVQPALTPEGDVLVSVSDQSGTRRLAASRGDSGWSVAERWTSIGLKPYFNDFVVHEGHAYGFDGGILAAIDLADGERRWKGGRYGHGQLVLLPEQDLLLVLSEKGELALVSATAEGFRELARRPLLAGKTWNHPVLVGDLLLARNDEEMVALRLSTAVGG